jgi:hypothetical protein
MNKMLRQSLPKTMNKMLRQSLPFIITFILIIILFVLGSYVLNTVEQECLPKCKITGIKAISHHLMSSDECIFETTCGDTIKNCYHEVGDEFCG